MDSTRLKTLISRGSFLRSVLVLGSSTVIGQSVVLLATPLLTRLYTPPEFGEFAVFISVSLIFLIISSLRYELAIALPRKTGRAELLFWLALSINAFFAVILLLIIWLAGTSFTRTLGTPILGDHFWLLPLVILFAGSYKALTYWAIRRQNFSAIGKTKVAQSLANVAIQIGAGLAGLGPFGLIVGWAVGQATGIATLWKGSGLGSSALRGRFLRLRTWFLIKKYDRFPKYDVPGAAVNAMSEYLPNVLLAVLFGPTVAGLYLLASRLLSVPSALIGQAVAQVLLGVASDAGEREKLMIWARNIIAGLTLVIALPSLLVFLWGESFFTLVFGSAWSDAGVYARWMIFGIAIQFIYSPTSIFLIPTNGQQLNLIIQLFILILKTAAIFYGFHRGEPLASVIAFSMASGFGYLMGLFLIIRHLRKGAMVSL